MRILNPLIFKNILDISDIELDLFGADKRVEKIISSGNIDYEDLLIDRYFTREELLLVHSEEYINRLLSPSKSELIIKEVFERDFRSRKDLFQLIERYLYISYGTYLSSLEALKGENIFFLGGGFHHAMSFGGRGFCLVNDIAITINLLLNQKKIF